MCDAANAAWFSYFPSPPISVPITNRYDVHIRKGALHERARGILMGGAYYKRARLAGMRILDFGCGDGWYLREARKHGGNAAGFEPDAKLASRIARDSGIPVYSNLGELEALHAGQFDIVTMHFVLEHLTDVHGAFETVNRLLTSGGRFYFIIPNMRSTEFRLFRKKWHGLDPPRHIHFLEPRHIRQLAARHGYSLQWKHHAGLPNGFAGSMSAALTGRVRPALFMSLMPPALIWSAFFPGGAIAWLLRKAPPA